jgi:hypothetical protein
MQKNIFVMDAVEKNHIPSKPQMKEFSGEVPMRTQAGWNVLPAGFRLFLAAIVLVAFSGAWASAEESGALIESITFHRESASRETVNFKLNGQHIPKMFAIKGEKPRVVFDFLDTRQSPSIKSVIKSHGNMISAIRTATHTDPQLKTRVVFDLAPGDDYDFSLDFQKESNILAITVFHLQTKGEKPQEKTAEEKTKKNDPLPAPTNSTSEEMKKEKSPTPAVEQKKNQAPVATPDTPPKKPVPSSPALAINMISFKQDPAKGEQISMQVSDFHPPVIFGVEEGTPSIVCDFLNAEKGDKVQELIPANGQFVKQIRVEKDAKAHKIRVVIELVPNRHYDLQQIFFKEENLYVLFVKPQDRSANRDTTKNNKPVK